MSRDDPMASNGDPLNKSPLPNGIHDYHLNLPKSIPILPSAAASAASPGDPMDTSHNQTSPMGPPALSSPNGDQAGERTPPGNDQQHQSTNGGLNQPVGAAAAAQQPKIVQTAFIHKLYKYVTLLH